MFLDMTASWFCLSSGAVFNCISRETVECVRDFLWRHRMGECRDFCHNRGRTRATGAQRRSQRLRRGDGVGAGKGPRRKFFKVSVEICEFWQA